MRSISKLALASLAGIALGAAAMQVLDAQTKPPAYAVLEVGVGNRNGYVTDYVPLAAKALMNAGGKLLARGGKVTAIDGEAPKQRIILVAFDSLEAAQAAFASSAYRDARKIGDKYATFRIWAVEGVPR